MRKKGIIQPRPCEQCGEIYQPTGYTQKYCPECNKVRRKESSQKYNRKLHPIPRRKSDAVCVACGAPFSCSFNGLPYCNKHYLRMYNNGTLEKKKRPNANKWIIQGDLLIIVCSDGKLILADADDYDLLKSYSWCISRGWYAVANINGKLTRMHRFITNAPDGMTVDHINGFTVDNRKSNLRICTMKENSRNMSHTTGRELPVGISTAGNKYRARIMVDRKEIRLGHYDTIEEAVAARVAAEQLYYGKFAPSLSRQSQSIPLFVESENSV